MLKLVGVGALILLMLIPLLMIQGVLNDRLTRRNEAVDDITSSWGKEQSIIGPVLVVPYVHHGTVVRSVTCRTAASKRGKWRKTTVAYAYFLPDTLEITGDVQTQTLHRGIYDAAVFRGLINISGKFPVPDMATLKIDPKDVLWKDSAVTLAVSDLRGTRESLMLDWSGKKIQLQPGSQLPGYTTGVTALLAKRSAHCDGDDIFNSARS
jgi:Inner membrane protein involved in colicin E2 resistance